MSWLGRSHAELEANARLIAAAPMIPTLLSDNIKLREALLGPQGTPECISPLSWLRSAIDDLKERGPHPDNDDPAAHDDMMREIEALYQNASTALAKD